MPSELVTTPTIDRSVIPVVIVCGGQGTRLREATERIPKPLVDIGDQPILWHIMKLYSEAGFRRFVLCLGYKSWEIKEYFLRYREHRSDFTVRLRAGHDVDFHDVVADEDWQVTCVETGLHSGTAARLRKVSQHLDEPQFLYTYGDGLGSVDIGSLFEHHLTHKRIGTVTAVRATSRYGEMQTDGDEVLEFNEKPTVGEGFVNGGFFVFDREVLGYLGDDDAEMFEQSALRSLARDGQLSMFPHEGFWMGMDTFREYTELNRLWAAGDAPWKTWEG